MQEEICLVLIKQEDIYIEIYSGTEEELSNITESIKNIFDTEEIKELKVNKEEYMSCKNDSIKLQELYNK